MSAPLCNGKTTSIFLWWVLWNFQTWINMNYSIYETISLAYIHETSYFWDEQNGESQFILIALQHHVWGKATVGTDWERTREIHSSVHMVFSSFLIIFNLTSSFQGLSCEALAEMGMTGLFTRSKIFQHVACESVKWVVCCIFPACIISGYVMVQSKWQGDESS